MMLKQTASAYAVRAQALHIRPLRLPAVRSVATEQESAASAGTDPSETSVKSTLSALDSLLPPVPQQQQPVTSSSQPSTSSNSSSSPAASTSGISSLWGNKTDSGSNNAQANRQNQKGAQTFEQVMGFAGFAPEVINGRAAMLGFLAAVINETHGDSIFSQLVAGGGVSALQIILVVVLASFAPAIRQVPFDKMFGKDKQPASFGPFTPTAELINGRAAMLGLLALVLIEGSNGQPFFL